MKKAVAILLVLLCSLPAYANEIDQLKTLNDVRQFASKHLTYNPDITGFLKADIDNNGLTDLFLNAEFPIAILDNGSDHYEMCEVYAGVMEKQYSLVDVIHTNNTSLLVVKVSILCAEDSIVKNDTLSFRFGSIVEYNAKPNHRSIKKVVFTSDCGYGGNTCLELKIESSGWATYYWHDDGLRIFAGIIDSASFAKLEQIIDYVNLPSLSDHYPTAGWQCMMLEQASYGIEINFADGQVKKILDSGGKGTLGLKALYEQLFKVGKQLPELQ